MKTPQINGDVCDWLEAAHDTLPRKGDSDSDLRWKGAQAAVIRTLRNAHEVQSRGTNGNQVNFKRKSDD